MDLLTENVPLTVPTAKPGPMTEMEKFIFECYGYIVIENVLSQDEIEETLERPNASTRVKFRISCTKSAGASRPSPPLNA